MFAFSLTELNTAWQWLVASRKNFPANSDIWHCRFHQATLLPRVLKQLSQGKYRLSPMQIINRRDGSNIAIWSSTDALILKLLTNKLQTLLPLHKNCTHIKNHGGHKYTVRQTHNWIASKAYPFVCKNDIKGYYASIDKHQLLEQLSNYIKYPITMNLLGQFLFYSVEKGGNFHTPNKGIPRGCPPSPLLAGFHIYELDKKLSREKGTRYLRFMDDLIILSKTRWQLKRAVAMMNHWFEQAKLKQHHDKTFIGRVSRGFNWLGYAYNEQGLIGIAASSINNFKLKLHRLYEQACKLHLNHQETQRRVADYVKHWQQWCTAGLTSIKLTKLILVKT